MSDENMLFAKTDELDVESALSDNAHESETEKFLIFRSGGLLYGVSADHVETILNESNVTYIPMLPPHVSGVINLRGAIVPIVDFRVLAGQMMSEESCIIVLDIDGVQMGIQTDSVDQMVDVEKRNILPVPSQKETKLVYGMCTLPNGGTMMVLDCLRLMHES